MNKWCNFDHKKQWKKNIFKYDCKVNVYKNKFDYKN